MALSGVALIVVVAIADPAVWRTSNQPTRVPLPDAGRALRIKASADSLRLDSLARISTPIVTRRASFALTRVALRDSAARAPDNRQRIKAAIEELRIRQIMVPIPGLPQDRIRDSFDQWRSNGTRRHNAIDLLAPRGTPILAADSGTILKMNRSTLGGISLYVSDPHQRFVYYYAHLHAYHPSITEGMSIARGDTIGFVGTTGNAPASSPHLHFAIFRTDDVDRWYNGIPINPREIFRPR